MLVCRARGDAATRGALQETFLDQVRLDHVLERAALLAYRGGKAVDAYRAAVELLDHREQEPTVHRVEAVRIHLEQVHRGLRDALVDGAVAFHLRVVAHAAQESVPDPRPAARTRRDLARTRVVDREIQNTGGAVHDLRKLRASIELEMLRDAETVAQRRREQASACRRADERERLQRQLERASARALADHDVELEIFEGRIERLLDDGAQAMDLVDEQ